MSGAEIFLRHGTCTIGVRCLDGEDASWLRENLRPAFVEERDPPVDVMVECTVAPHLFEECGVLDPKAASPVGSEFLASAERLPGVAMDGWVAAFPRLPGPSGAVLDTDLGFIYRVSAGTGRVSVAARRPVTTIRIALLRLIRELAGGRFPERGAMAFHASALAFGETGVLICGPKRAGKTSVLTHLLGSDDCRYIANDRSLLARVSDGSWKLSGIPTVVSVRADLPERLGLSGAKRAARWLARETLARSGTEARRDRTGASLSLSPAQYLSLLEREACAEAPLGLVLFPRIDPTCDGIRVERLSEAEVRRGLEDAGMPPRPTMFNPELNPVEIADAAERTCAELAGALPGYGLTLGHDAYALEQPPGAFLRRLPA